MTWDNKPESVWDYPRPPRLESTSRHVQVVFRGVIVADSRRTYRVLETSHPPVFYIPSDDVRMQYLTRTRRQSLCEFKGLASYYDLDLAEWHVTDVAWSYAAPVSGYEALAGALAFYPGRVDRCLVDGEEVRPQAGGFYGGWITSDVVGPFKGEPGTEAW